MKKKLFVLLMSLTMVTTIVPALAYADETANASVSVVSEPVLGATGGAADEETNTVVSKPVDDASTDQWMDSTMIDTYWNEDTESFAVQFRGIDVKMQYEGAEIERSDTEDFAETSVIGEAMWEKVEYYTDYGYDEEGNINFDDPYIVYCNTFLYVDTETKIKSTYYYRIRSYNTVNGKRVYTEYTPVQTATATFPEMYLMITCTGSTTLKLSWYKEAGAQGYHIYKLVNGKYTKVKDITSGSTTSWKDTGLTKGKTYKYKIAPYRYDENGKKIVGARSYPEKETVRSNTYINDNVSYKIDSAYDGSVNWTLEKAWYSDGKLKVKFLIKNQTGHTVTRYDWIRLYINNGDTLVAWKRFSNIKLDLQDGQMIEKTLTFSPGTTGGGTLKTGINLRYAYLTIDNDMQGYYYYG